MLRQTLPQLPAISCAIVGVFLVVADSTRLDFTLRC